MKTYIYALIDPFTEEIRYIGKTIHPKTRLANECNEKSKTYRTHWIQSVIKRGKKPGQVILEELAPDADWKAAERKWIKYGREAGWPLVNCTDGGDGVDGLPKEIRERMSKVWLGRKHKPESIEKMRKASTGVKHSKESKEYMHDIMMNRKFTPEWKEKISKANCKFTDEDLAKVKEMLSQRYTVQEIANIYGVHRTTISKIKAGKYPN